MLFNKKLNKNLSPFSQEDSPWLEDNSNEIEGQLSIDVYQTEKEIIVRSTLSGVKPENLKISLHHDLLTIKGFREEEDKIREEDFLYKECYWGSFSRSIILPFEVDNRDIKAEMENGILTISLKKIKPEKIEVISKD